MSYTVQKPDEFGTPLTDWYKREITDMANDNYYKPESSIPEPPSEAELEAYDDYTEEGGDMSFIEWQEYNKRSDNE